jgi:serine/threonine protein kinase
VLHTGPDWWVKIGDFGISKRVMEGLTGLQTFNGMPAFTAPEMYEKMWGPSSDNTPADTDHDTKADIWGLGVITYYMLAGRLPFSGKNDLLEYSKGNSILPFDSSQSPVSPEATCFLRSTMAAKPTHRPTTGDALDHAWLIPMLQDPQSDQKQASPFNQDTIGAAQWQSLSKARDTLPSGKIDLAANAPRTQDFKTETAQQMQASLGLDGDTYKQLTDNLNHARMTQAKTPLTTSLHTHAHFLTDTESIAPSQSSDSQYGEPALRTFQARQISVTPENFTPYARRRSDAAPIPITELSRLSPSPGSPTSRSSSQSITSGSDTFSKLRRASRAIMPKPSRHSQEHTPISPVSPNTR